MIGRHVVFYECVESTNSLALELAHDRAADGLVLVAREQTAGRGQHGRSWSAPPGSSVLLSAILFPPPSLNRPAILTAWAGVSVCEAICEIAQMDSSIKWPNDVLIGGKKTCGILIEQRNGTVVGIGLNVEQSADFFVEAGLTEATSLSACASRPLDSRQATNILLRHLDATYRRIHAGDLTWLEDTWRERLGLVGRPVTAECHDAVRQGVLSRLTFAEIELDLPGGGRCHLTPEAIRHLRPL